MLYWLIVISLTVCWYMLLSKRYQLVTEKKKRKQRLQAFSEKKEWQPPQWDSSSRPPEYIIWDISTQDDFGE